MIDTIQVISRKNAAAGKFDKSKPYFIISITDPGTGIVKFDETDKNFRGVFRQMFFDAEYVSAQKPIIYTEEMAKKVVAIVKKLEASKEKINLVIHCHAGLSRSPSTAAAISKYLGDNDKYFLIKFYPNYRVYDLLVKAFGMESDADEAFDLTKSRNFNYEYFSEGSDELVYDRAITASNVF